METTVTINGEEIAAQPDPRRERIEQCGNRILIASNGVLHEVFQADNTMFNGVNDVDPMGNPLHFTGRFEDNVFLLTPILTDTTQTIPDISRELIQNDGGDEVLKLFNPLLGATPTRYLRKETDIVATRDLILTNDFKVVPNPFQNETLLTWDNLGKDVFQAQLLNVSGQVVRKYRNVSGESLRIEKRDLLPGIYFLNIIDGSGHFGTLKLLMQE